MTRLLMIPAALGFALFNAETLATDYTQERTLRVETTTSLLMETVDRQIEVNGEVREGGGFGGGGSQNTTTIVHLDTVLEQEDGVPTKVRRVYESVEGMLEMEGRDGPIEMERESDLDGITLLLSAEGDGGEVTAEVEDGDSPDDDAILEGHSLTLALDALLPAEGVEAETKYEVEGDALMAALGMDLAPKLFRRPEFEGGGRGEGREGRGGGRGGGRRGGGGGSNRLFEGADWSIEAQVESLEEEWEGQKVAKITFEIEGDGTLEDEERGGRGGRDGRGGGGGGGGLFLSNSLAPVFETDFEIELEGVLYYSIDAKHPVRLELEGTIESEQLTERDFGERSMTIYAVNEGSFTHEVTITVVEDED